MAGRRKQFQGITRGQAVSTANRREDVRRFGQKLDDWTATESGTLMTFGVLTVLALLVSWAPFLPEMIFVAALWIFLRNYRFTKRLWKMPFRVPAYLGKIMRGTVRDSTTGKEGKGNLYLGKDLESEEEFWANTSDVNKHALMIGTTGSGKTEAIMANMAGFLALGSGCLIVDGKASANTFDSTYKLMRFLGRDADLLVMDYLTGGEDMIGPQANRRSHTYNPLSFGGAGQKSEVMVSLMTDDGDIWSTRAISFMEALLPPLAYLDSRGHILLNPGLLGEYFDLLTLENLLLFGVLVDLNGNVVWLPQEFPEEWNQLEQRSEGLLRYIRLLPGYTEGRASLPHRTDAMKTKEAIDKLEGIKEQVKRGELYVEKAKGQAAESNRGKMVEQHGYITMQFTRAVGNLSDNYGFIYRAEVGEIDFRDVVLNRRALVVLLPSLERSKSNLEQLGKMTVLSLKAVLGALLQTAPEGARREIIVGNPSNSRIPFLAVLDEVGYYIVEGISVIPAQARSLGVATYFGTQDIPSLSKGSEAEGKAIIDNTAMKFFGRVASDSESDTVKTAINMGGRSKTQVAGSMRFERGTMGIDNRIRLEDNSSLEDDYNIAYNDLAQQEDGEFHAVIGAKEIDINGVEKGGVRIIRMLSFFTGNLQNVKDWRRIPFAIVKKPSRQRIVSIRESERAEREMKRSLAEVLQNPSHELRDLVAVANKSMVGRFLEWRQALVDRGDWPADVKMRKDRITAWAKAEVEQNERREAVYREIDAFRKLDVQTKAMSADLGDAGAAMLAGVIMPWAENRLAHKLRMSRGNDEQISVAIQDAHLPDDAEARIRALAAHGPAWEYHGPSERAGEVIGATVRASAARLFDNVNIK